MPIIKSAIKKMRQDVKKTARNDVYRKRLKSRMKELIKAAQEQKTEQLPELLKETYSIVDLALKKNLIKKNNAARKKSRMSRLVKQAMIKGKVAETTSAA
jgi:small subunit ribosomal protein S20